jgi:hypothetical protein
VAQRGNSWEIPAGDGAVYDVQIMNGANPPAALTGQYAGTEPLTAYVWMGSTQANVSGAITAAWVSGTAGTTTATIVGSVTSGMTPGYYRVRLEVTYAGVSSPYYGGWLNLLPIPGSTPPPPVYCAYSDLTDRAGDWLPRLQQATGETDFAFERGRARSRLDSIIVGKSRVYAYTFDLNYATIYGMFPWGPVESPDYVITGYLASNFLVITDQVIDITAYNALGRICEKRMSFDEDGQDYAARARYYYSKEAQCIRGYRCQINSTDTIYPNIAFNCGLFQFR